MKKLLLIIFSVLYSQYLFSQDKVNYLVAIEYGSPFNFIKNSGPKKMYLSDKLYNNYNHSVDLTLGLKYHRLYFNFGVNFSTKKYFEEYNPGTYKLQYSFSLNYFQIPLLLGYDFISKKKMSTSFHAGILFIKSFGYNVNFYENWELKVENSPHMPVDYKLGNSMLVGLRLNYNPKNWFGIFLDFQYNYKFNMDFVHHDPSWVFVGTNPGKPLYVQKENFTNLLDNRHCLIIKLGLNFVINPADSGFQPDS